MRKCFITDNPLDGDGIVCAPKGDGVKATLFFPKFLNAHFVSVIGNLVQLRVDSGIKICSRRIIVYSFQRFVDAVKLLVSAVVSMGFHIPLQKRFRR